MTLDAGLLRCGPCGRWFSDPAQDPFVALTVDDRRGLAASVGWQIEEILNTDTGEVIGETVRCRACRGHVGPVVVGRRKPLTEKEKFVSARQTRLVFEHGG
jgi:hypothetical protein